MSRAMGVGSSALALGLVAGLAAGAVEVQAAPGSRGKSVGNRHDGKRLFERETFGGNGRSCRTCHSSSTGTVSPEDAQARLTADPDDALFRGDGTDDGAGNGVTRMLSDATILIQIPLPPNVELSDDPGARSVVLERGIPTTLNTPALDPILMYDGRLPNLPEQARAAINAHAVPSRQPTATELRRIAEFQLTDGFFSSLALRAFARGGAAPTLPMGTNEPEKRGRLFFEDAPVGGTAKRGLCATCHSGPMLNRSNAFNPFPGSGRFRTVMVSELNPAGNAVHDFVFTNLDGTTTIVSSPDPGRALITGRAEDANLFKSNPLWGIARTAPYFHDNSAKTLEQVMIQYTRFFLNATNPAVDGDDTVVLTPQDREDVIAFLKLLE